MEVPSVSYGMIASTVRKPNLNGKWISEKKYKKFFKEAVTLSLVENTKENRELYFQNKMTVNVASGDKFTISKLKMAEKSTTYSSLTPDVVSVSKNGRVACLQEGEGKVSIKMDFPGRTESYEIDFQVAKNFNEDESFSLVEMKISKIHNFGKKFLLTGKARIPANALPTEKEVKQLKKGKLDFRGKTYTVKKVFDEGTYLTTYYLYENSKKGKKAYDYELADITTLMNYPNPAVYDRKGNPVYDSVRELSVWIDQNAFIDMYAGSMEDYFYNQKSWKNRWIPMDVTKNCVTRIMTE